jgi:hypothetical protein
LKVLTISHQRAFSHNHEDDDQAEVYVESNLDHPNGTMTQSRLFHILVAVLAFPK